ncbi:DUF7260 family protein [Halospeciosus flavus]|uniref:DUF7260 domain-containing protein n=1 Tax=Halospeciosus flavus TaxID=3032283 RepID=A0ABD5Z6T2_9EURY|nr:hypothetical protein [Halospeciosus flavus]
MVSSARQDTPSHSTTTQCFSDARETLDREREILDDEIAAFDAFRRRVRSLESISSDASRTDGQVDVNQSTIVPTIGYDAKRSVSPIQEVYLDTVMAVAHYDEEYGEGWFESVATEFNPELASALRDTSGVPEYLKQQFLTAARRARDSRKRVRDRLDREESILDEAATEIAAIRTELIAIESRPFPDCSPAEVERLRDDLDALRARCHEVAKRRQNGDWHQRSPSSSTVPSFNEYLYTETTSSHPVLREIAQVSDEIETVSNQIARWEEI